MDLRAKGRNALDFPGAGGAADSDEPGATPDGAAAALANAAFDAPDPAETFCAKAEADALRRAVAALPPSMRTIVQLFYFDGLGVAEIAEIVAAPEGTVKYRLHEARRTMRRTLSAPTEADNPASNIKMDCKEARKRITDELDGATPDGGPLICPTVFPGDRHWRAMQDGCAWLGNVDPGSFRGAHVVVTVPPGGKTFTLRRVDAGSENMKVVEERTMESA